MNVAGPPWPRVAAHGAAPTVVPLEVVVKFSRHPRRMPARVLALGTLTLRPEAQVVLHMDGWVARWVKRASCRDYVVREPVPFAGSKLFYHNNV